MANDVRFACLTAGLVRRAVPSLDYTDHGDEREGAADDNAGQQVAARAGWRGDLRLFAAPWAAGFMFFLTFLA